LEEFEGMPNPNNNLVALSVATYGTAALLQPSGRTANSKFQLPLNPTEHGESWISTEQDLMLSKSNDGI
jgi:hypothetical protein